MSNAVIKKTSDEEGKFGEYISQLIYENYENFGGTKSKFCGKKCVDMSDDVAYQKNDTDHIYIDESTGNEAFSVEVKHDTWALGKGKGRPTNNIPFEILTHIPIPIFEKIRAKVGEGDITLDRLYEIIDASVAECDIKKCPFIGCNRKSTATYINYILSEEDDKDSKSYKFKNSLMVRNKVYESFLKTIEISPFKDDYKCWMRFTYHPEDKAFNLSIIVPIKILVNNKIASYLDVEFKRRMVDIYPQLFNEYHTSAEIKEILNV